MKHLLNNYWSRTQTQPVAHRYNNTPYLLKNRLNCKSRHGREHVQLYTTQTLRRICWQVSTFSCTRHRPYGPYADKWPRSAVQDTDPTAHMLASGHVQLYTTQTLRRICWQVATFSCTRHRPYGAYAHGHLPRHVHLRSWGQVTTKNLSFIITIASGCGLNGIVDTCILN